MPMVKTPKLKSLEDVIICLSKKQITLDFVKIYKSTKIQKTNNPHLKSRPTKKKHLELVICPESVNYLKNNFDR